MVGDDGETLGDVNSLPLESKVHAKRDVSFEQEKGDLDCQSLGPGPALVEEHAWKNWFTPR